MARHLLPVVALLGLVPLRALAGDDAKACLECHGDAKSTADFAGGGGSLSLFIDGAKFQASMHGQQGLSCTDCHEDKKPDHATGELAAKNRHEISRKYSAVCANCHAEVAETFARSVHGREEANGDVPVCSDCHDVHQVANTKETALVLQTPLICGRCHTDEKRMKKYGISTKVVDTYLADFHGMVTTFQRGDEHKRGLRLAAACTDCHGFHDIQRTDDPRSRVMSSNLQKTCQKCHEGAPAMFPQAWLSHWEPSPKKAPAVWAVRQFYRVMIPFMMSGLLLQIGLHVFMFSRNRKKKAP